MLAAFFCYFEADGTGWPANTREEGLASKFKTDWYKMSQIERKRLMSFTKALLDLTVTFSWKRSPIASSSNSATD